MASASVMRSTAPPSRKAGHVGPLLGHAARITDLRTLSWSSGAAHPPGGTSPFPPSLRRSTASKGPFLDPLVVPWLVQLNNPYTSPTRGRASSPRGSGTVPQSRSQGRAPSAPRAHVHLCVLRDRSKRKKKYQENDAPPEKIKRKIVSSDLRNPPKNFTPLFGEVAKFRTLTKKDEQ